MREIFYVNSFENTLLKSGIIKMHSISWLVALVSGKVWSNCDNKLYEKI